MKENLKDVSKTGMVRMDREVIKTLRIHSAESGKSMRELATKWIKEKLIRKRWGGVK